MKTSYKSQKGKIRSPLRFSGSIVNCQLFRANGWVFGIVIFAALLVGAPFVSEAATVTAIDPASGTNNGTTSITSVTGTNFKSGWDKENGLVGNWRLDENSGTSLSDSSGSGNTGTASGTATTTGKLNTGRSFSGEADYVEVDDSSSLDVTGALTASVWFKMNNNPVTQSEGLISKFRSQTGFLNQRAYRINVTTSGFAETIISSDGTNQPDVTSAWATGAVDRADGGWHLATAVFIPSTSLTLYIDGIQEAQDAVSVPASIL